MPESGENFSASGVADSRFLLALGANNSCAHQPGFIEESEVDGDISMKKPG
jgi:hypothetical protein